MRLRYFLALVAVSLGLVWCIPSVGQVLKGSISGTVVDPQGAVVSGAQVKAIKTDTGEVFTTTSDGSGLFRLNLIPTGTYKVEISGQGFRTTVQNNISVSAGVDEGLGSVQLSVGGTAEVVEVTGAAPLIETTQAQITSTYSGVTLQTFAGIEENQGMDRLALFVPGIAASRSNNFSNQNGVGFSSNGIRGRNNDQEIDGQNNNDNSVAGPALFVGDPEFVGQYVLVTNNFGPEYGRNSGSVVNIITKSGTNNWHGSIYGSENNSFLNALNNTQKNTDQPGTHTPFTGPPRSNDEFGGGTVGGPILKNKVFIFGGFDQEIVEANTVETTASLTPTPAGLAQLAACPGINASALSVLQNFGPYAFSAGNPTPRATASGGTAFATTSVNGCSIQVGGVTRILGTPTHNYNWILKTDAQLTNNDTFSARYVFGRNDFFNVNDNAAAGWVINEPGLSQAVLLSETHNFSPRMVNELRLGFGRENFEFGGGLNPLEPTAGNLSSAFTNIAFTGGFLGIGPATNLPQARLVNTWQAQDNWNWVLGKHSLKAGVNWTYQRSPNTFLPDINGAFTFRSVGTSSALNQFLTNNSPSIVNVANGDPVLDFREYDTFLYFGDDWKLKQNLTLNLGLTWTDYGNPESLFNSVGTAQQTGPNPFWNPALPLSITTDPTIPTVLNSFGPSVGFAYNPQWGGFLTGHGKTTIRGGYRLLYDPPFYNIFLNVSTSAPFSFLQSFSSATGLSSATFGVPAVPTGPNVRNLLSSSLTPGVLDPQTQAQTVVSNNFGPDKVHDFGFGIQREVTRNSAFEIRYEGNHAVNQYQTVNGNPYLGTTAAPGLLQTFPQLIPDASALTPCATTAQVGKGAGSDVGRVSCGPGVTRTRDNGGFSNYNSMQVQFHTNNLFNQLTLQTSYTYSKTLDNTSEIFATATGPGNTLFAAQNPFNTGGAEYGISGLNFPNAWSLLFNEKLPFFRQQSGALGHLLGGWSFSADYLVVSGQPYTPKQSLSEAELTGVANYYDSAFVNAFVGADVARPFYGNPSAPSNSVGIFAGDACLMFKAGCALPATQLISFNALNSNGVELGTLTNLVNVTNQQVRFIINARTAQSVFGTPFGNVPRNALTDAMTNTVNASLYKSIKLGERAAFEMHLTALNAFNHFNFTAVDTNLEDAGLANFNQGFANPSLTPATGRTLYVGGKLTF